MHCIVLIVDFFLNWLGIWPWQLRPSAWPHHRKSPSDFSEDFARWGIAFPDWQHDRASPRCNVEVHHTKSEQGSLGSRWHFCFLLQGKANSRPLVVQTAKTWWNWFSSLEILFSRWCLSPATLHCLAKISVRISARPGRQLRKPWCWMRWRISRSLTKSSQLWWRACLSMSLRVPTVPERSVGILSRNFMDEMIDYLFTTFRFIVFFLCLFLSQCVEPSKNNARWKLVKEGECFGPDLYEDDPERFIIHLQWYKQGQNSRRAALGVTG